MPDILPDLLQPGLKVVFCGMAAGTASALKGAYYAGPGNKFWPTLFQIGLTPHRLRPEDFRSALDYGIGLTDIAKSVHGSDASLPAGSHDAGRLAKRMRQIRPAYLAFNGKKAASWFLGRSGTQLPYGLVEGPSDFPQIVVLPSTSGAASGFWDEMHWYELARLIIG